MIPTDIRSLKFNHQESLSKQLIVYVTDITF